MLPPLCIYYTTNKNKLQYHTVSTFIGVGKRTPFPSPSPPPFQRAMHTPVGEWFPLPPIIPHAATPLRTIPPSCFAIHLPLHKGGYPSPSQYSTQTHSRHNLCLYAKETTRVTDRKTTQPNSSHKRPHTAAESRGRSSLAVLLNTFATVGKSICPRGMSGKRRICICVIR